eukprot:TRINITY_DN1493_c0_g1_i4.p1 TRINITY_DN1493_c0_g1~~TRINITY_DN1493_c0_g1_i4.p1  ORF type:complete len:174 (-),score=27.38 TRINITY_DN1493_c0_g1_i4:37-558(-)
MAGRLRKSVIEVTEAAAKRIAEIVRENPGTIGLRLGIKENKGCAGNTYDLALHKETDPLSKYDEQISLPGMLCRSFFLCLCLCLFFFKMDMTHVHTIDAKLIVENKAVLKVIGTKVDVVEEPEKGKKSFVFNNPNASSLCGCGTSFSTASDQQNQDGVASCSSSSAKATSSCH